MALATDLLHSAGSERLVGAPADQPGAVPALAAADVIGRKFGDQDGIEPDYLLNLAGPPAIAAGRCRNR
jgi:hypothetical protein